MVMSMTGYGRAQRTADNMEITAEIRSVNHRYFEFSARVPRQFGFLEEKLKSFVSSKVTRGKVEVYVSVNMLESEATDVVVNVPLAKAYAKAFAEIKSLTGIDKEYSVSDIARLPEVLTVQKGEEEEQAITNAVLSVMDEAVEKFIAMRKTEGEKLYDDVCSRCNTIADFVAKVEDLSAKSVVTYRSRLEEKMRELLGAQPVDEQRLITETAIFADKIAVDEETVRLNRHIKQLKSMISSDEPVGRKIDFLVQEMNRETNTIGSKSVSLEITQIVVDMKSEIEKIREQIQNIE